MPNSTKTDEAIKAIEGELAALSKLVKQALGSSPLKDGHEKTGYERNGGHDRNTHEKSPGKDPYSRDTHDKSS